MLWILLIALAFGLALWGQQLSATDEVYALAFYSASALSAIWGLAIAPSLIPIVAGVLALGKLQGRAF